MPNINDLDNDPPVNWYLEAGKGKLVIHTSSGKEIIVKGSKEIEKWAARLGIPLSN